MATACSTKRSIDARSSSGTSEPAGRPASMPMASAGSGMPKPSPVSSSPSFSWSSSKATLKAWRGRSNGSGCSMGASVWRSSDHQATVSPEPVVPVVLIVATW
ncbi:MAG: hypothetical protein E6J41_23380 [Chloroflexi bacterium]|nr:MAG: hypothetical protein E6J41_23380 [Chloroflexota bacterium]